MRSWSWKLFGAALLIALDSPGAFAQEDEVRVAIAGLASNLESFDQYKSKYRVTRALADSIEDARQRKWVDAISCEFLLIINGDTELFECYAPPIEKMNPKTMKAGKVEVISVPFGKGSLLKSGNVQLSYRANIEVASLNKSEWGEEAHRGGITPLGMGIMGVRGKHSLAGYLTRPDYSFAAEPDKRVGDWNTRVATFRPTTMEKGHWLLRFFLDPERGYLPLRHESYRNTEEQVKGAPKSFTELLEARECPGGRWFPNRVLSASLTDFGDKKYQITELQVLELNPDYKAPIEEFTIEIPAGTYIKAHVDRTEYGDTFFRTRQKEKVNVRDIAGMFDLLKKRQTTPLADTAIPHNTAFPWLRWSLILAGLLLVALVARTAYRRRVRAA